MSSVETGSRWHCTFKSQQVMPIHNGFHGTVLPGTRGKMEGGLVSPALFNVVVEMS